MAICVCGRTAGIPPVSTVTVIALMVPVKLMMFEQNGSPTKSSKNDDTLLRTGALFDVDGVGAAAHIDHADDLRTPQQGQRVRRRTQLDGRAAGACDRTGIGDRAADVVEPGRPRNIPVPLEIVPALVRLTVVASIPKNPPVTRPAFVTLAMFASNRRAISARPKWFQSSNCPRWQSSRPELQSRRRHLSSQLCLRSRSLLRPRRKQRPTQLPIWCQSGRSST